MKHCFSCGKCVMKYDHHCPWIGACVGEMNHFRFLVFLFFQAVQSTITFIVVKNLLFQFFTSLSLYEYQDQEGAYVAEFGAYSLFAIFMFFYLWFRATFPRYRYDQLMRLGWKVFLPLSLFMVFAVALVLQITGWAAQERYDGTRTGCQIVTPQGICKCLGRILNRT